MNLQSALRKYLIWLALSITGGSLSSLLGAQVQSGADSSQHGSGAVSGVVQDASRLAVPGATVILAAPGAPARATTTGAEGTFAFEGIEAGRYNLTVSANGFQEYLTPIQLAAGGHRSLRVFLEIVSLREAITVHGGDVEQLRDEVQRDYEINKSVTSIEGEMMLRNNPVNNQDMLRYLPGMMTAGYGLRDRFSTPTHIRGAVSWGNVETVDGYPAINITPVSAEDGGYTASFSTIIPSVAVKTMSLSTGGLGVTYGEGGGGVVRSFIKSGNSARPHASVQVEGVDIGELFVMGDTGGGYRNFDYYFAGQTARGDYGSAYDTYARPIQDLRMASGLAKLGYRVSNKGRAELFFVGGDERHSYFQNSFNQELDRDIRRDFHTDKTNYYLASRYDHRFTENVVFGFGATRNSFHENRIEDFSDGVPVDVSRRNRPQEATTGFGDLTWRKSVTDTLTYSGSTGVQLEWDRFRDITNNPVAFSFREHAVYYRNSFLSDNGFAINGGVRTARINNGFRDLTQNAYDVGVAYRLPTRTRLKASYSTGYKINKAFYLWWGGGQFIAREPALGLAPADTETTEFGVEQTLLSGPNASGMVRVSYFQTNETGLFNFGNSQSGVPYYDDARIKGLEIWSQWSLGRVRPFFSFTHLDNYRTGSTNPAATNVDLRFVPLPNYAAGFGSYVDVSSRFNFAIMGYYDDGGITEQLVNDQLVLTRFQGFLKTNASANFVVNRRLSLVFRAENLFNRRDLGYSRTVLNPDGSSEQQAGNQLDPGFVFAGGVQLNF